MVKKYMKDYDGKVILEYSPESFTGTEMDYALDICKSLKQSDLSGTGITLSGGAAFGTSHPWARFPYDTALLLRMCWQAIPADVRYMT